MEGRIKRYLLLFLFHAVPRDPPARLRSFSTFTCLPPKCSASAGDGARRSRAPGPGSLLLSHSDFIFLDSTKRF